ncbi:three-Cys-motif partner protein TcmP [Anaeromyxobacter terrae]|uniref:three-Cys-motif partner protein TcmP n=1 Tax=Anaeromyxobacter terrae TaxID=2925406 RepID=UPI001F5A902D|nr:three-Cys-motif partner protein TcmP [Anaeromyxobacter sp. SG22]
MVDIPEVGPWASQKLEGLGKYVAAYTKILSRQQALKYVYVDAFAAAGRAVIRRKVADDDVTVALDLGLPRADTETRQVIDGSPRVALNVEPPFTHYVFVEADPDRLAQLESLKIEYGDSRAISVREGDCNEYLATRLLDGFRRDRCWRGVVFLDPFGMQVPWSTIEKLAATKRIEVFINFPLGMAIQRLLERSGRLTEHRRAKLDAYFGDSGWYDVVYSTETDLFGDKVPRKWEDAGDRLLAWYRDRLQVAFGHVSAARLIKNSKGGHLYYLVFAGPNRTGAKIASHVLGTARAKKPATARRADG